MERAVAALQRGKSDARELAATARAAAQRGFVRGSRARDSAAGDGARGRQQDPCGARARSQAHHADRQAAPPRTRSARAARHRTLTARASSRGSPSDCARASEAAQEGVAAALLADRRGGAVAGQEMWCRRAGVSSWSRIERSSVAWSPRGRSVRPMEPSNSTSPTIAKLVRGAVEDDVAGRVARAVAHLEALLADLDQSPCRASWSGTNDSAWPRPNIWPCMAQALDQELVFAVRADHRHAELLAPARWWRLRDRCARASAGSSRSRCPLSRCTSSTSSRSPPGSTTAPLLVFSQWMTEQFC